MRLESGAKDNGGFAGRRAVTSWEPEWRKTLTKITLFGSGRDSPEPPSVGSTPGHPKEYCPYAREHTVLLLSDMGDNRDPVRVLAHTSRKPRYT
jgi:hypothetical protein